MGHTHTTIDSSKKLRFMLTMSLNFIITIAEIIGGILSGSLSLISDALHNLSDGVSVILSYIALKLKDKGASSRHTFGLKRAEILAATINASVLITISAYLFYVAIQRFSNPEEIDAVIMTYVALIGLIANIAGTLLLKKYAKESINIRSSYLHLLSDAFSSAAVIVGGLSIYYFELYWIDPLLTILIGIYIIRESIQILSEALHILMEGAPSHLTQSEIDKIICEFDEVKDLHHLHIWTVGENDSYLEAHLNISDMMISESDKLRQKVEERLKEILGVNHITLQIECDQCFDTALLKEDH